MIARIPLVRRVAPVAAAPVLLMLFLLVAGEAGAQGKSKGNGGGSQPAAANGGANGAKAKGAPGKRKMSHAQAVDVSREVLVAQGYNVQRVEIVGDTRVIYYYRGNNGRGKGRGPLERIVVRPTAERFVVEGGTRSVISAIMQKIGL
jgi:hypothetical protein